jgi:hypothetical protein
VTAADDLAALIQTVNSLRKETNTALGHLTPRNAFASLIRCAPNARPRAVWWPY